MNRDEYQKLELEFTEIHLGVSYRDTQKDIWILMRYQQELLENFLTLVEDIHFFLHQPKEENP